MDFYKNLPAPLRIGIPIGAALVLFLVVYLTVMKQPAPTEVVSTRDVGVYETAQTLLTKNAIEFTKEQNAGSFLLKVAPSDAEAAATALTKSGLDDRTGLAKPIKCPAAPGFTGTKAANTRADNCADEVKVQGMMLAAGAIAVLPSVNQTENGTLIGPETSKNVSVQLFLPQSMKETFDATSAAYAIKAAIGAPLDHIYIGDDELKPLFNGPEAASKTGSGAGSAATSMTAGVGCADMAGATEIATKEAAVSACKKQEITSVLTDILGSSDYFALTVTATINSSAKTVTTNRMTPGPVTARSSQKGGDMNNLDTTVEPGNETVSSNIPAGGISKLAIAVALDKNKVGADQVLAVKQALSAFVVPGRNDPAPTVQRTTLHKSESPAKAGAEVAKMKAEAAAKDAATGEVTLTASAPTTSKALLILVGLLVVGLIGSIIVLLRRSSQAAAERARYEAEFANQQQVFNTFVQQDPRAMAQDLEAMFAAESAPARL
jgi:hypothetical protein